MRLAQIRNGGFVASPVTYSRFHLIFNLPLLVVLFIWTSREAWSAGEGRAMALVLLAVFIFTTPWDNMAAKWGIWGFPLDKYFFKLGYLPIEEYAFFLLQSVNVMLGVRVAFHLHREWHQFISTAMTGWTYSCLVASVLPFTILGLQMRAYGRRIGPRLHYALHLTWFLPVIYIQWVLAPILFFAHLGLLTLVTFLFGCYYTAADLVAIKGGTWFFDERQIEGFKIGGILPWEEMAFFFLTSLLVAQSYLMLLPEYLR